MNDFLFVCSANLLRSPTAEHVARSMGYRADSAGTVATYDPVRLISRDAIDRACKIICMEPHHAAVVRAIAPDRRDDVVIWGIPDNYAYMDAVLQTIIRRQLEKEVRRG